MAELGQKVKEPEKSFSGGNNIEKSSQDQKGHVG